MEDLAIYATIALPVTVLDKPGPPTPKLSAGAVEGLAILAMTALTDTLLSSGQLQIVTIFTNTLQVLA